MASPAAPTTKAAPRKRTAPARKPVATPSERAATQTTTAKRNATVAGKARTRAAKATATEAKSGAALVGTYAERAVLVPVGAALATRDRVNEIVTELIDTYSTRKKTEAQLKRFERRGMTVRKRLEREAGKVRTRAEREVSHRRVSVERRVSAVDRRREQATKRFTGGVEEVSTQIQNAAAKVQETVKSIA